MERTGTEAVIEELGNLINQLRAQIMSYRKTEYEQRMELLRAETKVKELEDMLSKRPERIKREDQGLDKWNK